MNRPRFLTRIGVPLILLFPGVGAAGVTMPSRILTSAAQSGDTEGYRLVGSFGGLVMHTAAGGGISLAQGFWVPGQSHPSEVPEENGWKYRFDLRQNCPNPFNPRTAIAFTVPGTSEALPTELDLYDVTGRVVKTLVKRQLSPGPHSEIWDGKDDVGRPLATGVYFARLQSGQHVATKRLILLK